MWGQCICICSRTPPFLEEADVHRECMVRGEHHTVYQHVWYSLFFTQQVSGLFLIWKDNFKCVLTFCNHSYVKDKRKEPSFWRMYFERGRQIQSISCALDQYSTVLQDVQRWGRWSANLVRLRLVKLVNIGIECSVVPFLQNITMAEGKKVFPE